MKLTKHTSIICLTFSLVLACSITAFAQGRGRGGARMTPEKAEAVWKLQAEAVAKDLVLDAEKTIKLSKAFVQARKSQQTAIAAMPSKQQGESGSRLKKVLEVEDKERAKLHEALKGFLNKDQIEKAMPILGNFHKRWDIYVSVVSNITDDKKISQSAMKEINTWAEKTAKARKTALAKTNMLPRPKATKELKMALDTELAKILSEEEFKQWKEKTAGRGSRASRSRPGGAEGTKRQTKRPSTEQ